MLSISNQSNTNFNGKIGIKTLNELKSTLPKEEYNLLNNFRAGKNKFTNIELERKTATFQNEEGNFVHSSVLYAIISNPKKTIPAVCTQIGNGEIPLNRMFFARLSNAVLNAEKSL